MAADELTNIKQLTHGGENAEAYWSPDGKRLIFQSTRGDLKCDQIFIMNADGTDQHMVSTGKGRTTCGYFLPDNQHILYGTTALAGDACPPDADHSKGYVWAVYDTYDIVESKDDGSEIKRLTDAPGYDAEATVNFKTNKIVYTSMASGDLDLWEMNLDGSKKKQITKGYGYDGGAVFSHDGKKLVLASQPPGHPGTKRNVRETAEEENPDQSHERWNSTSLMRTARAQSRSQTLAAPLSPRPSHRIDKQILFASNKHECDSSKPSSTSLTSIGTGLRQVTSYWRLHPHSFPEFSPDGKKIVFVSDWKAGRYEFNVFTADWNKP